MKSSASILLTSAALLALGAGACDNPAKNATKALTTEAVPEMTGTTHSAEMRQATGSKLYAFDAAGESKIGWRASNVTRRHDGGFERFDGTATVIDDEPTKSKVSVEIDARSITSDTEQLTLHLKSDDFFHVERFPRIAFTSTKIEKGGGGKGSHTVTGNLTMHGVTKGVTFPATIELDGDRVSVDTEFSINRRDFEVNYKGAPNDLIRDEVVVKLAIRAKRT
jgi:polyisoprenoid-binding protein YceI